MPCISPVCFVRSRRISQLNPLSHGLINNPGWIRDWPRYDANGQTLFAFTRTHLAWQLVFFEMAFMTDKNTASFLLAQVDMCLFGNDALEVIGWLGWLYLHLYANKLGEAFGHSGVLCFSLIVNTARLWLLRLDKVGLPHLQQRLCLVM